MSHSIKIGNGKESKWPSLSKINAIVTNGYSLGISGASIGQIVKIESVDNNGIPTKWEAVTFPKYEGEIE